MLGTGDGGMAYNRGHCSVKMDSSSWGYTPNEWIWYCCSCFEYADQVSFTYEITWLMCDETGCVSFIQAGTVMVLLWDRCQEWRRCWVNQLSYPMWFKSCWPLILVLLTKSWHWWTWWCRWACDPNEPRPLVYSSVSSYRIIQFCHGCLWLVCSFSSWCTPVVMSYPLQSEPFSLYHIVFTLTPHRFLKYTHTKQSFRPDDQQQVSDLVQRSILGNLMPEAMICFLENYGGSVYVCVLYVCISMFQVLTNSLRFSSENSIPLRPYGAVRWGGCVCVIATVNQPRPFTLYRRMMIEKIAGHIAEFSPRLLSNTKSLYQYCAIPAIAYPQLENELFCNIYYLRHLCDTQRFPDWPIKEPVSFQPVGCALYQIMDLFRWLYTYMYATTSYSFLELYYKWFVVYGLRLRTHRPSCCVATWQDFRLIL